MNYNEYKGLDYAKVGEEILQFWKENNIFEKSIEVREGSPNFTFYEGPPSANGTPGIHHVMARTIKDIFCRYKTLQGYQVHRKGGWDTHGLPIELQVEKELGITKEDIGKKISVEDYNQKCREAVMRFTDLWQDMTDKMGYWVDMDDPYITYKNEYIESLWWLLKQLYDQDLLYKGYTIQPFSPAAGTGLSSHELNQPGTYKDVKDTTIVAQFRVMSDELRVMSEKYSDRPTFFLAWTTTPWTLPANTALTVGANIDYVSIPTTNIYTGDKINVIVARQLVSKVLWDNEKKDILLEKLFIEELLGGNITEDPKIRNSKYDGTANYNGVDVLIEVKHNVSIEAIKQVRYYAEESGKIPMICSLHKSKQSLIEENTDVIFLCLDNFIEQGLIKQCKGSDLEGVRYEQLLPYVQPLQDADKAFKVILGDFVTTEDGTGIVHTAPTFGADDYRVAKANGVPAIMVLDENAKEVPIVDRTGRFVKEIGEFGGRFVKEQYYTAEEQKAPDFKPTDVLIAIKLKEEGKAFKVEKYEHTYPHCWRTDKPILYYPLDSWFIATTKKKDRLVELNKTINWQPESTGTGRFGNWLENLVDWNLSRSRYWGTPLPIWRTEDGTEEVCIGSVEELVNGINDALKSNVLTAAQREKNSLFLASVGQSSFDLHRPYVDEIFLVSASEKVMCRETDLIDVWFDSGAMPYAQWHYPFGTDSLKNVYPADFISEGVDQTRGWFFTLHAIAGMLFDSVAFKNVVSTGLVLDKNGNKMSKRLGNAIDPFETLSKYGPDATRWYMITNAEPWDNLKFNLDGIGEVQRKFFGTLFNTYNFYALYANLDNYKIEQFDRVPKDQLTELDRWIISKIYTLAKEVAEQYDAYNPTKAGRLIQDFVCDDLSNWYVRLCRRRFWMGEMTADKRAAYQTLQHSLCAVAQFMSPIAPFFADWLYRNLTDHVRQESIGRNTPFKHESVHFTDWHTYEPEWVDKDLEESMKLAQDICSLVHSLRKGNKLKVRQPLQKVLIPVLSEKTRKQIESVADIIMSEVNVKHVEFVSDDSGILKKKVKPNFKVLGPKYGKDMKAVGEAITGMTNEDLRILEKNGQIELVAHHSYLITLSEVEIIAEDVPGWLVASENGLTVALDITITDELRSEGIARDVVNRIQNLRKDSGFEVTDKIKITLLNNNAELTKAITENQSYICQEVQAVDLQIVNDLPDAVEVEMDEFLLKIMVVVA